MKRLGSLLVVIGLVLVAVAVPAGAAELPVPTTGGHYAVCNAQYSNNAVTPLGAGGSFYALAAECNYAVSGGSIPAGAQVIEIRIPVKLYNASAGTVSANISCGLVGGSSHLNALAIGSTGRLSCVQGSYYTTNSHLDGVQPDTSAGATILYRAGSPGSYTYFAGTMLYSWAPAGTVGTPPGAQPMPGDWFPGGTAPVLPAAPPLVTCERSLSQQSDGSWIVNLDGSATGVPAGATLTGSGWIVPWLDGEQPPVSSLNVPPAPPAMGWSLEFVATYERPGGWEAPDPGLSAALGVLRHNQVWYTKGATTTANGVDGVLYYAWVDGVKRAMKRLVDGTAQVSMADATAGVFDWVDVGLVTGEVVTPAVLSYAGVSWDPLTPAPDGGTVWMVFDPAPAGEWIQPEPETVVASCWVLLDIDRPAVGAEGSTGPPVAPGDAPEDSSSGDGGCSAGPLGSVPLIGGVLDSTARLACTLGDLFGKLGRLITRLFIPEGGLPWSELTEGIETKFPFNLFGGISTFVTTMSTAATTGLEDGDACPVLGFGSAIKVPGTDAETEALNIRLPTPSDSGCPGLDGGARTARDDSVGDLFGWRTFVAAVFSIGLWLAVMVKLVRAFSPARETGLVEGG